MQFANICHCVEGEQLPRLVRRKVAMFSVLRIGFEKVLKSCPLFLATTPGLIDILCTVAILKVPVMIVCDVATKVLGTIISSA